MQRVVNVLLAYLPLDSRLNCALHLIEVLDVVEVLSRQELVLHFELNSGLSELHLLKSVM